MKSMKAIVIEDNLNGSFKMIPVDFGYVCINKSATEEKNIHEKRTNHAKKFPVCESGNLIRGYQK